MEEALLETTIPQSVKDKYLTPSLSSSRLLEYFIRNIIDLSNARKKTLEMKFSIFNLDMLLKNIQIIFSNLAALKGIPLIITKSPNVSDVIHSEKDRLTQILVNIISNAYKFTHRGEIRLVVNSESEDERRGEQIRFTVEDTGMGMTDAELATLRIVLQSHRRSSVLRPIRNSKGVCLGLTISQELACSLGSSGIQVSSKMDKGCSFSFTIPQDSILEDLPYSERPRSASRADSDSYEFQPSNKACICDCRRILIVDDNAYNIMVLKTKLTNKRFIVECASNGAEAIQVFENLVETSKPCSQPFCSRVNMILMDVDMPVMNGIDATLQLRRKMQIGLLPSVSIIGCSAYDSSNDIKHGLKAGMSDYISKPITEDKLSQLFSSFRNMSV
eukprot:TRINITY_DN5343_c0_g1_i7.p1 TRINITY_DN5343_c0_g1~~TRINITY_DN5343_c0_g1_i7.p1  ORF type:complete len:388 (-),score=27.28 TRINITY_DN5343_c0_g1_i7:11-1174(-)